METKKKLKARRMFANYYKRGIASFPSKGAAIADEAKDTIPVASHASVPVAVIPIDDVDGLITKTAVAIDSEDGTGSGHEHAAFKVLCAIGVLPKRLRQLKPTRTPLIDALIQMDRARTPKRKARK